MSEVAAEAAKIRDYNFRSYFVRRATEDKAIADSFSEEELRERLAQILRIQAVQNQYGSEESVVENKQKQ